MKEFTVVVQCDTALELAEALMAIHNDIVKAPQNYNNIEVDKQSFCKFGTVPSWEVQRSE